MIEDITNDNKNRVVHMRKNINGSDMPCSIRVFASTKSPMEAILALKYSYEHTAISHPCAIFFWPKLQQRRLYRVFENNPGLSQYPKGKTVYQMKLSPGKKTSRIL